MQFITPRGDRRLVVRTEGPALYDHQGRMLKAKSRRLFADFGEGIPQPYWGLAKERFPYHAEQTEKPIERFGGFYDSVVDQRQQDWTDDEREAIEQRLLEVGGDYVRVELPKAPLPYPSYSKQRKVHGRRSVEHVIDEIRAALEQTGLGPEGVIAYECDHADDNSQAIIDALTPPEPIPVEEEELVVA